MEHTEITGTGTFVNSSSCWLDTWEVECSANVWVVLSGVLKLDRRLKAPAKGLAGPVLYDPDKSANYNSPIHETVLVTLRNPP